MTARKATRLRRVVLAGRPNVGKSTLFNRITGARRAIVTSVPGTTRDVLHETVEWQGAIFELVDTGGLFGASEDPLQAEVSERGLRTLGEDKVDVHFSPPGETATDLNETRRSVAAVLVDT